MAELREWVCEIAEGPGAPLYCEIARGVGDPVNDETQIWLMGMRRPATLRFRYTGHVVHVHDWRYTTRDGFRYAVCACGEEEMY